MKTVNDLLEVLKTKGYMMPMRLELLLRETPRDSNGVQKGDGSHIIHELEFDRKQVFRCIFGDTWKGYLAEAQEKYLDTDRGSVIEVLLEHLTTA